MSEDSVEFFLTGGSWTGGYVVLIRFADVNSVYFVFVSLWRGLVCCCGVVQRKSVYFWLHVSRFSLDVCFLN